MMDGVCAVVVAYNRERLLGVCLRALQAQTRPPDTILVVDNASTDGTSQLLRQEFPQVQVLTLPHNVGGAGGFHEGMRWAYTHQFAWLWLMDDDARPAADCLAQLLQHGEPNSVVVPLQQDSRGGVYGIAVWRHREVEVAVAQDAPTRGAYIFRFVGPLIAREVVAQVGLPRKDFFIWFDDIEYALRIVTRTQAPVIVVPTARIFHDFGGNPKEVRFLGRRSVRNQQPAWKTYYGDRNRLYTLLRIRRNLQEVLLYGFIQIRLIFGDIAYEPDRWERTRLRVLGMRDGAMGRLGKRP